MARAKAVLLAGLLLACLAADVLAKPAPAKTKAKATAVYDCPDTPRFKGCAASGCALHMHGRTSTLICAECKSEKAYVLVNDGTRKAQCECAAGYAGKGQDGVCKKCPAGTDIAEGGAIAKSVCTKCPEGTFVNEAGTDCVCPAGTYKAASPDQPAGYKKMECKPCAARNAYVDTDGHSRDSCKVCTAPMLSNKDHTKCVMPDSPDAAPPGDGLLDALSQGPLGGLAQAFEEGRQQVRGQRVKGETPSTPLKSLATRVRNAVRRDSPAAAAEEQEDEYVEVEEAPTKAATKTGKKAAAAPEDVDVEIDQAVDQESDNDNVAADVESTSKHGSSHASKGDSHKEKEYTYGQHSKKEGHNKKHYAEEEEEEEVEEEEHSYASKKHSKEAEHEEYKKHASHSSKDKDTPSYKEEEKDSYSKPVDKKSYYEKRAASQSQGESDNQDKAEQQQQQQPPQASTKPAELKAAAEGSSSKQGTSGRSAAADKPEQKENTLGRAGGSKRPKSSEPRKMPPTKADPEVVKNLIPGLPVEMDEEEQEALIKKQAAAGAKQQPTKDASKAPTPAAAAPAGPVTLKDIAKKLGAAFGATAPVANPMGNPMGFIDPEALADAGLPPVNNVGQLMGALMKRQMADLDIGDFTEHITPHADGSEGGFM